jgi:multiple sugar transport system permease protein
MTSFSRAASGVVIYPVLIVGAVITIVPFGLGLLTSFTSAQHRPWRTTSAWPMPGSVARWS